ncbi:MAG: hypothetical protein KME42_13885 [Tildeniella nuda ZEHNDER 1965/U140]|jgi:hypothetical protein|nr:hypothetical protein [Tildeniella nuda ZEHNDER 1965/U140]
MVRLVGTLVIASLLLNLLGSGTIKLSVDVSGTIKVLYNVATFILTGQTRTPTPEQRNPVPPNGVE